MKKKIDSNDHLTQSYKSRNLNFFIWLPQGEQLSLNFSFQKNALGDRATLPCKYVMLCTIWYHLHYLKNMEDTNGGVLL